MKPPAPGAVLARPGRAADVKLDVRHTETLLKTGALQSAIFNSANFYIAKPMRYQEFLTTIAGQLART